MWVCVEKYINMKFCNIVASYMIGGTKKYNNRMDPRKASTKMAASAKVIRDSVISVTRQCDVTEIDATADEICAYGGTCF
jgi:hypothetical protein